MERTRILFYIGSLQSGGKERRLIELLSYLKKKGTYELMLVVTKDEVHYPDFYKLDIPYQAIGSIGKNNYAALISRFYKICKEFKPHLIHTWGRIQSLYTLPTVIGQRVPLINSQITAAPPRVNKWTLDYLIDKLNFHFSKVILSNSRAGIDTYNPPLAKGRIIYNGINLNRFINLTSTEQVKAKYGITTPYTVVMSASFSPNKDYNLFYRVATLVTKCRKDVTFIGVGACHNKEEFKKLLNLNSNNPRILLPGRIDDVEALVNASTIGVLFSNKAIHGEGISNSIMEYMALSKPVIANDAGGTKEILRHHENGYLIENETAEEIAALILELISDEIKCQSFGRVSRSIIENSFSLEKMGQEFEQVYKSALT